MSGKKDHILSDELNDENEEESDDDIVIIQVGSTKISFHYYELCKNCKIIIKKIIHLQNSKKIL